MTSEETAKTLIWFIEECTKLRKQNSAMRECLTYYASGLNYQMTDAAKRAGDIGVIIDGGDFANSVLDQMNDWNIEIEDEEKQHD